MVLYLICEVCNTPRPMSKEVERFLIGASHVQCPACLQLSKVDEKLKNHIKESWGMKQ